MIIAMTLTVTSALRMNSKGFEKKTNWRNWKSEEELRLQ